MRALRLVSAVALVAGVSLIAFSADEQPRGPGGGNHGDQVPPDAPLDDVRLLFKTDVPAHPLDVVLGRPTKSSITASVLAYSDREGVIEYGTKAGAPTAKTAVFALKAGQPAEVAITGLQPDTQYFYRLRTRTGATASWGAEPEHSFHTQRPPGRTFTFTVQADSHLDSRVEPKLVARSLLNSLSDSPDFEIDLGDTFMTDKYRGSRELAAKQYVAQRYYFGLIGHSAPVFLVLGNHDGESPRGYGSAADSLAVWSNLMRKRYFADPIPDDFYSGDTTKQPEAGLLEDYYAWEWGDALFVVLDPFWFTESQRGQRDNWKRTLGETQYQWLKRTLEGSKAKFKFIFLHHLVGGSTTEGRGGSEAAPFYEWGGKNQDGTDGFKEHRPGWPAPIHQLLVQNHVNIVFHGHDHIFAKQDLDGIVYQEVPQPGNLDKGDTNGIPRTAAEYGYVNGKILGSPAYMRITVAPDKVTADLVRSYLPEDESATRINHEVAFSYSIPVR